MLELFPEGFEEVDADDGVELAAYTDGGGEERLSAVFGAVTARDVADDWRDRWRRFHRGSAWARSGSARLGRTPPADAVAIVIDPGRAFGTGAHPTTRLCLELIRELPHGSLVDIGCGSG